MRRHGICFFQDQVCLFEALLRVAALQHQRLAAPEIAAWVNMGRFGFQCIFSIGLKGQGRILNLQEFHGALGQGIALGGYGGHFVADKSYPCVQDGHIRGNGSGRFGVKGCQNGVDARERLGCGGINRHDVGVGMRRGQHFGVEHPRQLEVSGVPALTGELLR